MGFVELFCGEYNGRVGPDFSDCGILLLEETVRGRGPSNDGVDDPSCGSIVRRSRGIFIFGGFHLVGLVHHKPCQPASANQGFNFILQLDAFICVVPMVFMEATVLPPVSFVRRS